MGRRNLNSQTLDEILDDPVHTIPVDLLPMVSGFLERRDRDLQELTRLMAAQDYNGIKFIGHRLKGTGGGFGLPVITEIGSQLETAAKEQDEKKVREFIQHLADVTKFLKSSL